MYHIYDRMKSKKWGVFNHFLFHCNEGDGDKIQTEKWNAFVNGYDVEKMAKTLHEVGAGYYFITLMQGRKYICSPNATFDRIAGTKPGEACSLRDLPMDLYNALKKYDIDLYLYFTGDGPYKDIPEGNKFGFVEPRSVGVNDEFVKKWASVLEEYAVRYGDKVKGWWLDGMYKDFLKYNEAQLRLYYTACKKGNPDCLVAFNDGVTKELENHFYTIGDMTAGEFDDFTYVPKAVMTNGVYSHVLAPMGVYRTSEVWSSWCSNGSKHNREFYADYVKAANDVGAAVTIDVKINSDGTLCDDQIEILKFIGESSK